MDLKLKRTWLYELVNTFDSMQDLREKSNVKFDYFAAKNYRLAKQEIADLEAGLKPSDEWKKLEEEREEINKKYALKDDKGSFDLDTSGPQVRYKFSPEGMKERQKEIEALDEKNREVIEKRTKIIIDFNKLIDEEMSSDDFKKFHRIKITDIPPIGKSMLAWMPLVDE